MGKQTFGGDDEEEAEEVQKKLKLSKFELGPDYNIRDLFWKILGSYAATKTPGIDLSKVSNQRMALVKAALSVIESRKSNFYGLSPQFVARYTLMMVMDGGWEDAFMEFLEDAKESRTKAWEYIVQAMKHLLKTEYKQKLKEYLKTTLRNSNAYPYALFYLPKLKNKELVDELRKEISIFARGDIDQNQLNAIEAIAILRDDEEVKKILLSLLNHWDTRIRKTVAGIIKNLKLNKEECGIIERRMEAEPDNDIKKLLKKAVARWKKK
jgi:hypothetical protein